MPDAFKQPIDNETAINIGAYTILSGVLHQITAGLHWKEIALHMASSADEISAKLPAAMVKIIDDMAVETIKEKNGA